MAHYASCQKGGFTVSFVNLVSGGLDSTLIGVMAKENEIDQRPLFIDYGQIAAFKEWEACKIVHSKYNLPEPTRMDISGFGKIILTGLTDRSLNIRENAFTPGRNFMFLLMGCAYAYQLSVSSVAIGLLSDKFSLFPDQRSLFLTKAEDAIATALGVHINVLAPLFEFGKKDVVRLAKEKGITGTYSCHTGNSEPCGQCIACLEFQFDKED